MQAVPIVYHIPVNTVAELLTAVREHTWPGIPGVSIQTSAVKDASHEEFNLTPPLRRIESTTNIADMLATFDGATREALNRWKTQLAIDPPPLITVEQPGTTMILNEAGIADLWWDGLAFLRHFLPPGLVSHCRFRDIDNSPWPFEGWSCRIVSQLPILDRTRTDLSVSFQPPYLGNPDQPLPCAAFIIKVKCDSVLEPLIANGSLMGVCNKDLIPFQRVKQTPRTADVESRDVWEQVYNQLCRYNLDYSMLATARLVWLCHRNRDVMQVAGPFQRYSADRFPVTMRCQTTNNCVDISGSHILEFIVASCLHMLRYPQPQLAGRVPAVSSNWHVRLRAWPANVPPALTGVVALLCAAAVWAIRETMGWLARVLVRHCSELALCWLDGTVVWTVKWEGNRPHSIITTILGVFGWRPSLRCSSLLGFGVRGTVWAATFLEKPFAIKISHPSNHRSAAIEWQHLDPVLQQDMHMHLPIPEYYGLFANHEGTSALVMSDAGDPLDTLGSQLTEEIRKKWEAAVAIMHEAGVATTDIRLGNAVWNGHSVTLVDFVDPDVW